MTYSSQGEGAEELTRLKDEERAVETEVHPPAPLPNTAVTILLQFASDCMSVLTSAVSALFPVLRQGCELKMGLRSYAMATRRSQADLWHSRIALVIKFIQHCSFVNMQRGACEGQRLELQQTIGQQERELRTRQSASPAELPSARVPQTGSVC